MYVLYRKHLNIERCGEGKIFPLIYNPLLMENSCSFICLFVFSAVPMELELQLPAYTTATAMWNPSCVYDLDCSSWQLRILTH